MSEDPKELQAFIYKQSLEIERLKQIVAELEATNRWLESQFWKGGNP